MLRVIENRFLSASYKTKIELFILPILILLLIYLLYGNIEDKKSEIVNHSSRHIVEKKFDKPIIEFFGKIEKLAIKNRVKIIDISNSNLFIDLRLKGKLRDIKKFILKLEYLNNFIDLKTLNILKDKKDFILSCQISLEKYYKKYKINLKDNPKSKKTPMKLKAIIGEYIIINSKILQIGGQINAYKIIKVTNNSVILQNKKDKIKLKLEDEKFKKRVH